MEAGPVVVGRALTVMDLVAEQPDVCVKVKLTVPKATPVMTPAFVTVAMAVLLLTQEPPLPGVIVLV
jgi:hypothetical protein